MKAHGLEMKGPISSGDGVNAIEIEAGTGKVTVLTDIEIDGDVQLDGNVNWTYGTPLAGKVLRATDATGTLSWAYQSVPSGKTVLFEKNTAVTGYTLQTDLDDYLVYITKGSAAGGDTGGATTSGSTWTQPSHDHGGGSPETDDHAVTISEMPSHRHTPGLGGAFLASGARGTGEAGDDYQRYTNTDYAGGLYDGGPADGHNHTLSSIDSDATVNTWRPYGRNFTRQTKN
jgi:hypothetical protein